MQSLHEVIKNYNGVVVFTFFFLLFFLNFLNNDSLTELRCEGV